MWREWCFFRVMVRHFRTRMILMILILLGGGTLFMIYEPEKGHTLPLAIFYTWELIFAEIPEEFPSSYVLRAMFFILPVLGITVIIEGIIDFALMMRDRRRSERSWTTMLANSYKDHIVLVGCGRLGYRTFLLLRKMGEAVVVIERDEHNQFLEELRRDGSPIIIGDARREALLRDVNIEQARSIILATDDDMANLETALDARKLNPKIRVVLRMFDQNVADKVSTGFNIHLAMSQSFISAPSFALSALEPSIEHGFVISNRVLVMQRWLVRSEGPLNGRTVGEVVDTYGLNIVEHRPVGEEPILIPSLKTKLKAGDGVIVQGPFEVIAELKKQTLELIERA